MLELNRWNSGDILYAKDLNNFVNSILFLNGLNTMRTWYSSGSLSDGFYEWFGDVFTNGSGKFNRVHVGSTTAIFDSNTETYNTSLGSDLDIVFDNIEIGSNITTVIGVPLFYSAYPFSIKYQIYSDTGSSGWLGIGSLQSINSITPNKLKIRLYSESPLTNPIQNNSFELGSTNWNVSSDSATISQTISTSYAYDGTHSWKFSKNGDTNAGEYVEISQNVDLSDMKEITIYWYKDGDSSDLRQMYLQIWLDNTKIIDEYLYNKPGNSWFSSTGEIPIDKRTNTNLKIRFYAKENSVTNYDADLYVDNLITLQDNVSIKGFIIKGFN